MPKSVTIGVNLSILNVGLKYYETAFIQNFFTEDRIVGIPYGEHLESFVDEIFTSKESDTPLSDDMSILMGFIESVRFKFSRERVVDEDNDTLSLSGQMMLCFNGDMRAEHASSLKVHLIEGQNQLMRVSKVLHNHSDLFFVITEQLVDCANDSSTEIKAKASEKKRFLRHSQFLNEIKIETNESCQ